MQNNNDKCIEECKVVERATIRRVKLLSCIEQEMLKRLCTLVKFYIDKINRLCSVQQDLLEKRSNAMEHCTVQCVDTKLTELEGTAEMQQFIQDMTSVSNNGLIDDTIALYKELQSLLMNLSKITKSTSSTVNESKYSSNNNEVGSNDTAANTKIGKTYNRSLDKLAKEIVEEISDSTTRESEKDEEEESNTYFINNNKEMLQQRLRHNRSKRERQYDSLHPSRQKCVDKNKSECKNNNGDLVYAETNAIDILACIQPLNTYNSIKRETENASPSSSLSSSSELECEENNEECNDDEEWNEGSETVDINDVNKEQTKRCDNSDNMENNVVAKSTTKITNKGKCTSDQHDNEQTIEKIARSYHSSSSREERQEEPNCQNTKKTTSIIGDKRDRCHTDKHRDNASMIKTKQKYNNMRNKRKSVRASHSPSPRCTPAQYWDITFPASLDRNSSSKSSSAERK